MVEPQVKAGTIVIPEHVKKNLNAVDNIGVIIAIGASAWLDENEPRAKVGDRVMITKFAGMVAVGKDKQYYRIVNDRDVYCVQEGDWNE